MKYILAALALSLSVNVSYAHDIRGYNNNDRYYSRERDRHNDYRRDRNYRDYCKKDNTGTIVGGLAGGIIGNKIAKRGNKTVGTIIGGISGAVVGSTMNKKCKQIEYF